MDLWNVLQAANSGPQTRWAKERGLSQASQSPLDYHNRLMRRVQIVQMIGPPWEICPRIIERRMTGPM